MRGYWTDDELEIQCGNCGKVKVLHVPWAQMKRLAEGELIQNVLPAMSADDRELIKSGICGECFDKMFGEEE